MQSVGGLVLDRLSWSGSEANLRKAAGAVWKAFQELWNEGVVHGDIHPGNILVQKDSQANFKVKIFDLGLATCFQAPVQDSELWVDEQRLEKYVGQRPA